MKLIGLTGGIGSGKSTVVLFLREAGIPVIDADETGHRLLEEDTGIRQAVADSFGLDVMENGLLSREKLAARVFVDEAARRRLNELLHPVILQSISAQCASLSEQGERIIVVEAALLSEGGIRDPWLSGMILVLADTNLRIERLTLYRNMGEAEARRRMAAQTPPERKVSLADWIIYNNGDLSSLREQVAALAEALRGLEA